MATKKDKTEAATEATAEVESKTAEVHTENDPMEELVEYTAPVILGKADQTIFVGVNGENIRIQRGVTVKIKRKFKEVLDNAEKQEMSAYSYMAEAQKGSAKALADLN